MSQIQNSTEKSISSILNDLPNTNAEKVLENVKKMGIENTARILGYDLSHYENLLASGRLLMLHLQQNTPNTVDEYLEILQHRLNPKTLSFFNKHKERIQKELDLLKKNDFEYDFFSAYTMIKTYLAKPYYGEDVCETPQFLFMRIAIQLYHDKGIEKVIQKYKELSEHYYTPASPTIFNSGFKDHSLSSCFLTTIEDDLDSILYTGIGDQGKISKDKGGIGIDYSRVRHSTIGYVGMSRGIIPFIKMINELVRAVDQGSMRKGAATVFLRPHHYDAYEFCDLVLKVGDKNERANDINIALWCPWIFFDRIRSNGKWTLFCPSKSKELNDIWGVEFYHKYIEMEKLAEEREKEFLSAEKKKKAMDAKLETGLLTRRDEEYKSILKEYDVAKRNRIDHKVVKAMDFYQHVLNTQRKAGMPYIAHADAANAKSNQKNIGMIRSSNLCMEIMEHSSSEEIASCNLSSISLRRYVKGHIKPKDGVRTDAERLVEAYDFEELGEMARSCVENLNQVIDHNKYPLDKYVDGKLTVEGKIRKTNMKHRPIGLGVSGLAEAFHGTDIAFQDPEAILMNKMMFACIYYNSLVESVQLAILDGKYQTFDGSPFSEGKLQFDLWRDEYLLLQQLPD